MEEGNLLEFFGLDGVAGRGVCVFDERRAADSDEAFCHFMPSLIVNSIFLALVGSRSLLFIDRRTGTSVNVILPSLVTEVIDVMVLPLTSV